MIRCGAHDGYWTAERKQVPGIAARTPVEPCQTFPRTKGGEIRPEAWQAA